MYETEPWTLCSSMMNFSARRGFRPVSDGAASWLKVLQKAALEGVVQVVAATVHRILDKKRRRDFSLESGFCINEGFSFSV